MAKPTLTLFRGQSQPYDPTYNLDQRDYEFWTDSLKLAALFAKDDGYVYMVNIPNGWEHVSEDLFMDVFTPEGPDIARAPICVNHDYQTDDSTYNEFLIYTPSNLYENLPVNLLTDNPKSLRFAMDELIFEEDEEQEGENGCRKK